jgi:beta-lactamase class A
LNSEMIMQKKGILIYMLMLTTTVYSQQGISLDSLKKEIGKTLGDEKGYFAVAFKDLSTGNGLFINEHVLFHAASTMKTPVLIEAYKQAAIGQLKLSDSMEIKNEFKSIADSSMFSLNPKDDSEFELYKQVGQKKTIDTLIYQMITVSSNLATNLLVDRLQAKKITQTMRELGAKDLVVLRGVEDQKAYEKGMNNMVTAYDLMLIFEKIATGAAVSPTASNAMIKILLDQHFRDIIPAKLPANVKVAHKTGFFTGVHHDSGIVFLPDGRKYLLVILSKNLENEDRAVQAMATVSALIFQFMMHS